MKIAKRIFTILACFFVLTFATFALTSCGSKKPAEPSLETGPGFELNINIDK